MLSAIHKASVEMKGKMILLRILLLIYFVRANTVVRYVTPHPATPCPGHPCLNLSEYAHHVNEYIAISTTFVFLPGKHYLDTDFNVSSKLNLSFVGSKSLTRVVCTEPATVSISNVSQLLITGLEVTACGKDNHLSFVVDLIEHFALSSFQLVNSSRLLLRSSRATFEGCKFTNNIGNGCGGSVKILSSNVTFNGSNSFNYSRSSGSGGGLCVIDSYFIAHGKTHFSSNMADQNGGGMYSDKTALTFIGEITFEANRGQLGSAITMKSSTLNLSPNTAIVFVGNQAREKEGATVYVIDNYPILYCVPKSNVMVNCTIQVLQDYSNVSLIFVDNFADFDLYGGMIDRCKQLNSSQSSSEAFDKIINNQTLKISSPAYQLCFCNGSTLSCQGSKAKSLSIFPGETFHIGVASLGQRNGVSSTTVQAAFEHKGSRLGSSFEGEQMTNMTCTFLQYTVITSNKAELLHLYPSKTCGTTTSRGLKLSLTMKECPAAFQLHLGACICHQMLRNYSDSLRCNINNQSITRAGTVWIGYNSNTGAIIIHPHCPYGYCKTSEVSITVNSTNSQCARNRSGMLCGACQEGLSLKLGTSHCGKCSNSYLFLLLVFAFAGVALVFLLLVLRLTVAEGTINGLILYVNILHSTDYIFLPQNKCIALKLFLAWSNLDFGIDSCFYDGMDMYQSIWLQFVFPIYIWVLIGVVIFLSKKSYWITRKLGTNPVSVFATLLILSYNKILHNTSMAFCPAQLQYSDGSTKMMWLHDANISYLENKHVVLFTTALLVAFVLVLPYTLLLLFGQCFQSSNLKLFSWVNKPVFKYFLDTYHAPYKSNHRYWTGMMMMARVLLLVSFVTNISSDPRVDILAVILVSSLFLMWMICAAGVYKSHYIEILDASFLLNLIILSAATYYCQSTNNCNQAAVGYASLGVAFIMFVGILIYHIYRQSKETQILQVFIPRGVLAEFRPLLN